MESGRSCKSIVTWVQIHRIWEVSKNIEWYEFWCNVFKMDSFPIFTIKPLILKNLCQIHTIVNILLHLGEISLVDLKIKAEKYSYIFFCKLIGLYKGLIWHATSELEAQDIKQKFKDSHTFIAPNLPAKYISKPPVLEKKPGELRLVFVSRIFLKKI